MGVYAADIETSGLLEQMQKQANPRLHNICAIDIDSPRTILIEGHQRDKVQAFLDEGHTLVMHNGKLFDMEALKLLGYDVSKVNLIDSLPLSWYLEPNRMRHGLAEYGEEFGVPKPEIEDWENQTQEEYNHRVMEDCKIQKKLWQRQVAKLNTLYGTSPDAHKKIIAYLMQKMEEFRQQQANRWKLDVEGAISLQAELEKAIEEKTEALRQVMPKVAEYVVRKRPAAPFKKNGELSEAGKRWKEVTEEAGLPFEHTGDIKVVKTWKEGNPASHTQIKAWLDSLGWEPITFKFVRGENGEPDRNIPQINLKGGEVCQSVKDLIPKCAGIEHIAGLGILNHRVSVVKGFLRDHIDGEVTARMQGLTNTLRVQHRECVNLPSLRVKYGKELRGLLVARPGKRLLGSDLSSLEDRLKHHFQWKLDPEYVKSQMTKGFDPHNTIAVIAGLMTQAEADWYAYYKGLPDSEHTAENDKKFKRIDEIRAVGKSTNYACLPTDNTDVLTPSGWVKGDKVRVGDVVMGYNKETGRNEWCKVTATHFYGDAYVETRGHTNWQVESTLNHRWYGQKRKQFGNNKTGKRVWQDAVLTTEELKQDFNILNTTPFLGGNSEVEPHEAALVAWLLSDGYYKWSELSDATSCSGGKKKGIVASIAQASHKFQCEIREILHQNNISYAEDSLKSLNENTVTSFRLKSADIRSFLDRVVCCRKQKHDVDWVSWVLGLNRPSLAAFVHSFWLADGDSKGNFDKSHITFKQNHGNIADALVVAGYLLGMNVTHRGDDKISTVRFQKKRKHTTCQEFKKLGSRNTDVFCLTTELDTFVIRQNGIVTITGNCQYGAGVATIARTAKVSTAVAKKLHAAYHKMNWSIAKIAGMMVVKKTDFGDWQINPINKMWYSLRSDKDRFSTLIQGTGAYILDLWLYHCERIAKKRGLPWVLLGQFHDELIIEIDDDKEQEYYDVVADGLKAVNDQLKLNRELACDIKFGDRYSDIH